MAEVTSGKAESRANGPKRSLLVAVTVSEIQSSQATCGSLGHIILWLT